MGVFLSELFDQFDQEEQARIRAAEASTTEILAQGAAAVKDRRRLAESLHDSYWVLQPENDARADSGGVVFVAYVNALWRKTDAERAECIHDFLAKVEELIEPVLTKYGWEGKDLIAELRGECQINASQVHSMLRTSPASTTPSTEDSAASSPQDGTDHVSGHSEATGAAEQSEMERGQSGDADRPVISVQPPAILEFSDSWRKRMRRTADLNARCARQLGRNVLEFERQEELLKDARAWAKATLREIVSEVQDVLELKERVVKQTEPFIQRHRYYSDFGLGYREFESALWEEGSPSLEDRALEAVIERADSAASQAGAVVTGSPAEERGEDRARLEATPPQGIAEGAMADLPQKKPSKALIEASLASKLSVLAHMPPGLQEQILERYANQAHPDGNEKERDEFKRYWRERLDRERERRDRPGTLPRGGYSVQGIAEGAMLAEDPFNEPAIQAQIQADVARIEADWLEWHAEANTGNLDDKIVETLVAVLDAHALGYLSAVSTKLQIPEFLTRLRSVGGVLIHTQREQGVLCNPYSEDRLRAIAESSANVIRLRITGTPEEYAAALKSEIERTRVGLRKEAEQWVHWSSGASFRIESNFEARYRDWEAKAIQQVQRRADPLIQNYEFCEAMKEAHENRKIITEDSFRRLVVETLGVPENEITAVQWLDARLKFMKEYGAVEFVPSEARGKDAAPMKPLRSTVPPLETQPTGQVVYADQPQGPGRIVPTVEEPLTALAERLEGAMRPHQMNLTSQQKDLLFVIVDAHLSGDGAPFIFVQSHSGSGLCYPGGRSIPVSADEVDFRQLADERLITFVRVSGPGLRGKPTQLGIDTRASLRGQAGPSGEAQEAVGRPQLPPAPAPTATGTDGARVSTGQDELAAPIQWLAAWRQQQQDIAVQEALERLGRQPGWAQAQIQLTQADENRARSMASGSANPRQVGFSYYKELAEAWLGLVTDSQSTQDFYTLLPIIVENVYRQCLGATSESLRPASADAHQFQADLDLLDKDFRKRAAEQALMGAIAPASTLDHDESSSLQPTDKVTGEEEADRVVPTQSSARAETVFHKTGDFWRLAFAEKSVYVKDSKGMRYIAELLRCPGQDIHVSQLLGAVEGQGAELRLGSAGTILDETTRTQYKDRGEALTKELAEAKRNNDLGRQEAIEMELEQMAEQLASATGLGGRDRKASDDVERARKRVSRVINTAIEAIREHHLELADHFDHYVERGQFCCYRRDGIDWQL